jgi:hypothetical protein
MRFPKAKVIQRYSSLHGKHVDEDFTELKETWIDNVGEVNTRV